MDTGCPLSLTFWLGLPFPGWGLTPVLPVLLCGLKRACRPRSCCPVLYLPSHWASFPDLSFHSTAKGYDKTLPGQWHHSSGLSPALGMWPPHQRQDLKRLCQPMAALVGLPWANSVASSTLCPSSVCVHCREGNWDQRGGENGEPH